MPVPALRRCGVYGEKARGSSRKQPVLSVRGTSTLFSIETLRIQPRAVAFLESFFYGVVCCAHYSITLGLTCVKRGVGVYSTESGSAERAAGRPRYSGEGSSQRPASVRCGPPLHSFCGYKRACMRVVSKSAQDGRCRSRSQPFV